MTSSRSLRLKRNTLSSFILQITTVISGFILPRLILQSFGSQVNGLINSITQFLGVITLLESGVGTVVQSALYKPLAEKDNDQVSRIYISASKFFRRVALIFVVYVVILIIVYPLYINNDFDYAFTATLILSICISSFAQYYFGIANSLLLEASQMGFIQYTTQIIALIINIIACFIVIKIGGSIQVVKLTTSFVFLCRPLVLNWYVKKHYSINRKIEIQEEPIQQKWYGMAQHFSSYVFNSTDVIVLTILSTLSNVSIYSVYHLVTNGVFLLVSSLSNGFFSYFGDVWAREEKQTLDQRFSLFELFMHFSGVVVFGCTATLILDFVKVYTNGITDVDYIQPMFGLIIVIASSVRLLRIPYNYIILAAGKFKQTQRSYVVTALLNIVISIITVKQWGLIGVAIGTLLAIVYQFAWQAIYCYKNLLGFKLRRLFILVFIDVFTFAFGVIVLRAIHLSVDGYLTWLIKAVISALIWAVIGAITYGITNSKDIVALKSYIGRRISK